MFDQGRSSSTFDPEDRAVRFRDLIGVTFLLVTPIVKADEPTNASPATAEAAQPEDKGGEAGRPIAERFALIRAEFEAQRTASREAISKAKNRNERRDIAARMAPDEVAYFRRMAELAASFPDGPAARDALLWVINQPARADIGAYADEFTRAATLLVRHHGDDPEAVRIGLSLDNFLSFRRDALLLGFYAAAKGREARGLARMALAQYLGHKAGQVAYARKVQDRPKVRWFPVDDEGKPITKEMEQPDELYAYHLHLRQCDAEAIRAEAVRLYEEVLSEYGDVPYVTRRDREAEELLEGSAPGKPLTAEERRRVEKSLGRKRTLGQEAEARLDEMFNLAIGKPAPEIDGVDLAGERLKLSDYRGKVVVLVFWGSWCGPCMQQVPHEREIVERLKGRPFALLGVDCEADKGKAREVVDRERMTWPNWYDGAAGEGPIAGRYHIRGYPSVFVLDAKGVIRARHVLGESLDQAVDKLLEEMNQPASGQDASQPGSEKRATPES